MEKGFEHTAEEFIDFFLREDRVWHDEVRTHGDAGRKERAGSSLWRC